MLKDKVVVITGGAGLLGKAFVEAVIENQGIAIIADIDIAKAIQTKNSFPKCFHENIDVVEMDITNKNSINEVIKFIDEKYNKIDALVNNAYPRNKNYGRHFFDVEYEDFVENLGVHLGGYFNASKLFAKYFIDNKQGNIINISSIYGVLSPRFEMYEGTEMTVPVEYVAAKSGLNHLSQYMAKYLKNTNVRVNSISIGGILDNQPESFLKSYNSHCLTKGMLQPEDIKGSILYLLSDLSSYVNGQNIIVDDGFTL